MHIVRDNLLSINLVPVSSVWCGYHLVVAGTTAGTVVDDVVSNVIILLALFMRYAYKGAHQRSAGVLCSYHMRTTRLKHTRMYARNEISNGDAYAMPMKMVTQAELQKHSLKALTLRDRADWKVLRVAQSPQKKRCVIPILSFPYGLPIPVKYTLGCGGNRDDTGIGKLFRCTESSVSTPL